MLSNARSTSANSLWLYAGIFFMFGSLGMLIAMLQPKGGTWTLGIAMAVFSGLVALGWAFAFATKRYWVIVPCLIIPFIFPEMMFGAMSRRGWFDLGSEYSTTARLAILAILIGVGVSIGFTLVVQFITRSEKLRASAQAELDVAKSMHDAIVPPFAFVHPIAEVFAKSDPSSAMGGDLIDGVVREDGIDFFLADVSGHGVGAGIVMGILKSSIRTRLLAGGDLGGVLTDVNTITCQLTRPDMFATLAAIRVREGVASCGMAGHLPILHYHASEQRWSRVENQHLPLGIDTSVRYESVEVALAKGDLLAVFTDGLSEVFNERGQFGIDGVARVLAAAPNAPLGEISDRVFEAVRSHGPVSDDQSILLVRIG